MRFIQKPWIYVLIFISTMHSVNALQEMEQQAIQDIISGYTEAWNQKQGVGFADGFAEDADFVNIFGMHFSGKGEIVMRHKQILQNFLKGSTLEILSTQLREVYPGLVIALVRWRLEGFRQSLNGPGETREGIFTHVFIYLGDRWEITASHNTLKPN
jgi:uncharacterized protein (TIGR02246 family)